MIEYKNFTNECGIYCFTNKINGKCYVGQGINLKKRLRSHYSAMKRQNVTNMIFYTAVAKYGIENFDLEVLEFLDPALELTQLKSLLDEKEKFYIKEKNSYVPNGYNQTLGGDAGVLGYRMTDEQKEKIRNGGKEQKEKSKKKIWIRKVTESKYQYGYTYEQAAEKTGVSIKTISSICNNTYHKQYCKGWIFAFDEITLFNNCASALRDTASGKCTFGKCNKEFSFSNHERTMRPVVELDSTGQIIKEFPSVNSVVEELQCKQTALSSYLHNPSRKNFLGRIFKFKVPPKKRKFSPEQLERLKHTKRNTKSVAKYDLNNNLIESYNSIKEAADSVGTDRKSIYRCCAGKAKTCKKFIWKFI